MACVEFEDPVATLCMESTRLLWEKEAGGLESEAVRRLAVMGIYKKTIQTPRPPNITRFACAHIQLPACSPGSKLPPRLPSIQGARDSPEP